MAASGECHRMRRSALPSTSLPIRLRHFQCAACGQGRTSPFGFGATTSIHAGDKDHRDAKNPGDLLQTGVPAGKNEVKKKVSPTIPRKSGGSGPSEMGEIAPGISGDGVGVLENNWNYH